MERHEPWLAGFIASGIAEWLRMRSDGRPSTEYWYKTDATNIAIHSSTQLHRLVRILKPPSEGFWPPKALESKVSDGSHSIPAIFFQEAATQISHSYAQSSLNDHQVVVARVTDPYINITAHCHPPRAELLINVVEIVRVRADANTLGVGSPVSDAALVKQRLLEYSEDDQKRLWISLNRMRKRKRMESSPESIKSQPDFSPNGDTHVEDEEDVSVSQLNFCTQAPFPARQSLHGTEAHMVAKNKPTGSRVPEDQRPAQAGASRRARTKARSPSPINTQLVSQVPVGVSSKDLSPGPGNVDNPVANNSHVPNKGETRPVEKPVSRPAQSPDHRGNGTNREGLADQPVVQAESHLLVPAESLGLSKPAYTSKPSRNFDRWRQEARAGRYIPRYIQNIPKDQQEILDSDQSWQPSLVGQPAREGQVPLVLLERLSNAADNHNEGTDASATLSNVPDNGSQLTGDDAVTQGDPFESKVEENSSDSEEPLSEWPSSPPTQERRRKLPPDSPSVLPHQLQPEPDPASSPSQQKDSPNPPKSKSSSPGVDLESKKNSCLDGSDDHSGRPGELEALETIDRPLNKTSDLHEPPRQATIGDELIASDEWAREQNTTAPPSRQITGARSVDLLPRWDSSTSTSHPRQLLVYTANGSRNEEYDNDLEGSRLVSSANKDTTSNAKVVQVKRTPYVGKEPVYVRLGSALVVKSHQGGLTNTQSTSLGYVPSTFDEPAQGVQSSPKAERNVEDSMETRRIYARRSEATESTDRHLDSTERQTGHFVATKDQLSAEQGPAKSVDWDQSMVTAPQQCEVHTTVEANKEEPIEKCRLEQPQQSTPAGLPNRDGILTSNPYHRVPSKNDAQEPELETNGQKQSSKRQGRDAAGPGDPEKAARTSRTVSGQNAPDEDYGQLLEKLREYRRQKLTSLSVPKPSKARTASAPGPDSDGSTDAKAVPLHAHENRIGTPRSAGASLTSSSTPITRVSTYDEGRKSEPRSKQNGSALMPNPTSAAQDRLFSKFKVTYADYEGTYPDFVNSCNVLRKILASGQMLHPSLFDDAVFHHYHSYRRYLSEEAFSALVPLSFYDFYNERIEEPSHTKKVITKATLSTAWRESSATGHEPFGNVLNSKKRDGQVSQSSNSPQMNEKDRSRDASRLSSASRQPIDHDTVAYKKRPSDAVEKWREEASGAASPELGTPNLSRRVSDILPLDVDDNSASAMRDNQQPPSSLLDTKHSARTSRKRVLPWDTGVDVQIHTVKPTSTLHSRTSLPLPPPAKPHNHISKRPRLSASPFVRKPGRRSSPKPALDNRKPFRSSEVVEMPEKWWEDPHTPYKRFVENYDRLWSTRQENGLGLIRDTSVPAPPDSNSGSPKIRKDGQGIDVFTWRN
ncbi:hypothetical protein KCU88_g6921, partial [Aureobasidium melanogenum]